MLEIEYKGGNCVVISTKKSTLVVDPKLSLVGLSDYKQKGVVELATEERFIIKNQAAALQLDGPGDYEVADFSIRGVAARRHIDTEEAGKKATIYRIEVADMTIGLLGNVAPDLDEQQLETLGMIDILIVPVGNHGYTLDAISAEKLVRQIEPKVVIPVHYADASLKYEVEQDELGVFTKQMDLPVETVSKYKLKQPSQLPESLTTVVVERS